MSGFSYFPESVERISKYTRRYLFLSILDRGSTPLVSTNNSTFGCFFDIGELNPIVSTKQQGFLPLEKRYLIVFLGRVLVSTNNSTFGCFFDIGELNPIVSAKQQGFLPLEKRYLIAFLGRVLVSTNNSTFGCF